MLYYYDLTVGPGQGTACHRSVEGSEGAGTRDNRDLEGQSARSARKIACLGKGTAVAQRRKRWGPGDIGDFWVSQRGPGHGTAGKVVIVQ